MAAVVLPPLVQRPSPNYSSRHGTRIDLVVWHETAGSYAGAVGWLCNPASQVSAHLVVREDGLQATQLVKIADKAWTQGNANPRSIGVEHATVSPKGYATEYQLRVSARIFGWLCLKYGIPPRWARGGVGRGVCRHGDIIGSDHPYCGPFDKDWQRFLVMLGDEVERGGYRKVWAL